MHCGSSLLYSRKALRLLCLLILAVVIAVLVPTVVSAATDTSRTDPPKYSGIPNIIQSEIWGKAPAWAAALSGGPVESTVAGEVIVEFARGTQNKAMIQTASVAGATLKWARPGKSSKTIPFAVYRSSSLTTPQLMARLKSQPGVVAVAPNGKLRLTGTGAELSQLQIAPAGLYVPNDPGFGQQWALENTGQVAGTVDADIDALTAWELTKGSGGVVVAVIDSGVDYTHPDLAGNIWGNAAEVVSPSDGVDNEGNTYVDDVHGIDVVDNDGAPLDGNGHGTHVAGIIAAVGGNGVGTTGVAWQTKIMVLRAFDSNGAGTEAGVIECINYAIDMKSRGVNVAAINASFEGDTYNQAVRDAIQAAGDAGIVFVAAAGNTARNNDITPVYPAAYDCSNVLSVGASNTYDAGASFSNYGATSVDLFAPGVDILSTVPSYPTELSLPQTALFFDDMESGASNWTATGTWAITNEANWTAGGAYSWSDSPDADYAVDSQTTLTSRTIDLSGLACTGRWLGFAILYELEEGYDALVAQVSGDDGASWEEVGRFTGSDDGYFWVELPETVVTSTFKVRFLLDSDEIISLDGVYIDDVSVAVPAQTAKLQGTSMAAPHVTGAVALLAAAAPAETVGVRIDRILTTVDKPAALAGLCLTGGRLNVGRAVLSTVPEPSPPPPPPPPSRQIAQQNHPKLFYAGTWSGAYSSLASGGSFRYANSPGAAVNVTFKGTSLTWLAKKGSNYGKAWVKLDDRAPVVVDLYSSYAKYKQRVYQTGLLADGEHTLTIYRIGQKNASSKGYNLSVDAFDLVGELTQAPAPPPLPTTYQNTDSRITYLGSWGTLTSRYASGGNLRYSSAKGSAAIVQFNGTAVELLAKKAPNYGKALICLDGVWQPEPVDFYSASTLYGQSVFSRAGLCAGAHTLIIKCMGEKNPASGWFVVDLDAVRITGTLAQASRPDRMQETRPPLLYTEGAWQPSNQSGASYGTLKWTNFPAARVTVAFKGTYLAWIAKTGPQYGKAKVSLDGSDWFYVDLYSPSARFKQAVYSTGYLEQGSHTLVIEWTGLKNPRATGTLIDVDAFDVLGTLEMTY